MSILIIYKNITSYIAKKKVYSCSRPHPSFENVELNKYELLKHFFFFLRFQSRMKDTYEDFGLYLQKRASSVYFDAGGYAVFSRIK